MSIVKIGLFKNKNKKKETHPDYQSSYKDESDEWQNVIAGWANTTKDGDSYVSLSIDVEKLEAYAKTRIQGEPKTTDAINNDNLPF